MTDAIRTQSLTKYYGPRCVVRSLDLRVPVGSVYGFLGRNGAGKSTTIRMLLGMARPSFGKAELAGAVFAGDGQLGDERLGLGEPRLRRRAFRHARVKIAQQLAALSQRDEPRLRPLDDAPDQVQLDAKHLERMPDGVFEIDLDLSFDRTLAPVSGRHPAAPSKRPEEQKPGVKVIE